MVFSKDFLLGSCKRFYGSTVKVDIGERTTLKNSCGTHKALRVHMNLRRNSIDLGETKERICDERYRRSTTTLCQPTTVFFAFTDDVIVVNEVVSHSGIFNCFDFLLNFRTVMVVQFFRNILFVFVPTLPDKPTILSILFLLGSSFGEKRRHLNVSIEDWVIVLFDIEEYVGVVHSIAYLLMA